MFFGEEVFSSVSSTWEAIEETPFQRAVKLYFAVLLNRPLVDKRGMLEFVVVLIDSSFAPSLSVFNFEFPFE